MERESFSIDKMPANTITLEMIEKINDIMSDNALWP